MDTPLVIPFRKSIWRKTAGYQFGTLSPDEFDTISQIYDVFSAKLRIAFPICVDALVLAAAIDALPDNPAALEPSVLEVQIRYFLKRVTQLRRVAIKVVICSLADWQALVSTPPKHRCWWHDKNPRIGSLRARVIDAAGTLWIRPSTTWNIRLTSITPLSLRFSLR